LRYSVLTKKQTTEVQNQLSHKNIYTGGCSLDAKGSEEKREKRKEEDLLYLSDLLNNIQILLFS